jgi:hypothetical protein
MPMGVDRELLSQCQLDDRLILATPEEREDATEDRERETRCSRHRAPDSARFPGAKGG